jgi:hypothetical protein
MIFRFFSFYNSWELINQKKQQLGRYERKRKHRETKEDLGKRKKTENGRLMTENGHKQKRGNFFATAGVEISLSSTSTLIQPGSSDIVIFNQFSSE